MLLWLKNWVYVQFQTWLPLSNYIVLCVLVWDDWYIVSWARDRYRRLTEDLPSERCQTFTIRRRVNKGKTNDHCSLRSRKSYLPCPILSEAIVSVDGQKIIDGTSVHTRRSLAVLFSLVVHNFIDLALEFVTTFKIYYTRTRWRIRQIVWLCQVF